MNKTLLLLAAMLLPALASQGCAQYSRKSDDASHRSDIEYTVKRGDQLGDIALEITGDVKQWRAIATHNGIDDPRTLQAGTRLLIPASLLPEEAESATKTVANATVADSKTAVQPKTRPVLAIQKSPDAHVVVSPVTINKDFNLIPIDAGNKERNGASVQAAGLRQIKVIGSYYPKGIYVEPATNSRILMRVAPGARFTLERQINNWYKIITDQGTGYLRAVDGRILDELGKMETLAEQVQG
ncbi:MAG: LysM peptidoglycan-binding domain-containing protein [Granulosicoccus sp.]